MMKATLCLLLALCGAAVVLPWAANAAAVAGGLKIDFNWKANMASHFTDGYRLENGKTLNTDFLVLRRTQDFTIKVEPFQAGLKFDLILDEVVSRTYAAPPAKAPVVPLTVVGSDPAAKTYTLRHDQGAIGSFYLQVKTSKPVVWPGTRLVFLVNYKNSKDQGCITGIPDNSPATPDSWYVTATEHVENEQAVVWRGSSDNPGFMAWASNHRDVSILVVALWTLKGLDVKQRADITLITRWLSVRTQDVLEGNWSGDYFGGTEPWFWSSSTQIIKKFEQQKRKSAVKYGQCWVFACLQQSLSRAMGIPTRVVTNFDSAHEHAPFDSRCTTHYKRNSKTGQWEQVSSDNSVWNFHVWNEAYFRRPDLTQLGNAGTWNAFDATPQEESTSGPATAPFKDYSQYMTGPAALPVLKSGTGTGGFDYGFIGSESNCVLVKQWDYGNGKVVNETQNNLVGEMMITKAPDDRCSIEAKDASGGYVNQCEVNLNRNYSRIGTFFLETEAVPVKKHIDIEFSHINLGYDLVINIAPKHPMGKIGFQVAITLGSYTNSAQAHRSKSKGHAPSLLVHTEHGNFDSHKNHTITLDDKFWIKKEVLAGLRKFQGMQIHVTATPADESLQPVAEIHRGIVRMPTLDIKCPSLKAARGGNLDCHVTFENPLPLQLHNAKLRLSVSGQASDGDDEEAQSVGDAKQGHHDQSQASWSRGSSDGGSHKHKSHKAHWVSNNPHTRHYQTPLRVKPGKTDFHPRPVRLSGCPGSQYVLARLSTNEIAAISGTLQITVVDDHHSSSSHGSSSHFSSHHDSEASEHGEQSEHGETTHGQESTKPKPKGKRF